MGADPEAGHRGTQFADDTEQNGGREKGEDQVVLHLFQRTKMPGPGMGLRGTRPESHNVIAAVHVENFSRDAGAEVGGEEDTR